MSSSGWHVCCWLHLKSPVLQPPMRLGKFLRFRGYDDASVVVSQQTHYVIITSLLRQKRRHFDVITSKWRRSDVITTLLLRHVFSRVCFRCVLSVLCLWVIVFNNFLFCYMHYVILDYAVDAGLTNICRSILILFYVLYIDGILLKGPCPPCLRMANRAVLAGYPRYICVGLCSKWRKNTLNQHIIIVSAALVKRPKAPLWNPCWCVDRYHQ